MSSVFQYQGYTFYVWIIHKNLQHVCKIPDRPRPGAVEGLGTADSQDNFINDAISRYPLKFCIGEINPNPFATCESITLFQVESKKLFVVYLNSWRKDTDTLILYALKMYNGKGFFCSNKWLSEFKLVHLFLSPSKTAMPRPNVTKITLIPVCKYFWCFWQYCFNITFLLRRNKIRHIYLRYFKLISDDPNFSHVN